MKYLFAILTMFIGINALAGFEKIDTVKRALEVFNSGKPMVVMMGADWCGACISALPHFKKAAGFFEDSVNFVYLDSDKVRIKGIKFAYIPAFVAGKTLKEVKEGKSLNKQESRFVPGFVEYTTKYTGVKP